MAVFTADQLAVTAVHVKCSKTADMPETPNLSKGIDDEYKQTDAVAQQDLGVDFCMADGAGPFIN